MSDSLNIGRQSAAALKLAARQQEAGYRRNIILFGCVFVVAAAIVTLLLGVRLVPGSTNVKAVMNSGIAFLLLGLLFCLLLYKQLPFLQEPGYTTSMQYAGVVSVGVLMVVFLSGYFRSNASLITALFYSSLFLLPYTIYQSWLFYQVVSAPVAYESFYLPPPDKNATAATVFLNSIPLTIRLAPTPDLAEAEYPVTVPGRLSIGNVFSNLIYDPQDLRKLGNEFEDIKEHPYGWQFFTPGFANMGLRQLEAERSLHENGIKSNTVIIARRVQQILPA